MKPKATAIYLLQRLLKMLVTVWVVMTIIFFLVRLMPSNPVDRYIEDRPDVKFCVSVFRQSQEWRWKTGRILAWIP